MLTKVANRPQSRSGNVVRESQFLLLVLTLSTPCLSWAQQPNFDFTFKPLPGADVGNLPNAICNIPGQANRSCNTQFGASTDSTTPFIQETITLRGKTYYHLVVGQPDSGFAQEVLISTGTTIAFGNVLSDSGGGYCLPGGGIIQWTPEMYAGCDLDNNARAPLSAFESTGNGSGNPEAVIMKQIVSDAKAGFAQEFLKDQFNKKPKLSQTVDDATISSTWAMDMSKIGYSTDSVSGDMTNKMTVKGQDLPGGSAQFDTSLLVNAGTNITAGRYKFTPNTGRAGIATSPNPYWSYGTYTYFDGSIDPVTTVDWSKFRDPAQNP